MTRREDSIECMWVLLINALKDSTQVMLPRDVGAEGGVMLSGGDDVGYFNCGSLLESVILTRKVGNFNIHSLMNVDGKGSGFVWGRCRCVLGRG